MDVCADVLVSEMVEDVDVGAACVTEPRSLVTEPRTDSRMDSRPSEMAAVLVGNKEPTRDESRDESNSGTVLESAAIWSENDVVGNTSHKYF
jgi:hypothetical protein